MKESRGATQTKAGQVFVGGPQGWPVQHGLDLLRRQKKKMCFSFRHLSTADHVPSPSIVSRPFSRRHVIPSSTELAGTLQFSPFSGPSLSLSRPLRLTRSVLSRHITMGNVQAAVKRAPKSMYQGSWGSPVECHRPQATANISPAFSSVDAYGNLYSVAVGHQAIYKLTVGSEAFELYAGIPGSRQTVDGHRLNEARFADPQTIEAYDPQASSSAPQSRVWIADKASHVIRVITPDQMVLTFAGRNGIAGSKDGRYGASIEDSPLFNKPTNIVASRNKATLYIYEEGKPQVRIIDLENQTVSTVAFSGPEAPITSPYCKIYIPLHMSYPTETIHVLDGASFKTYSMELSSGACLQIEPSTQPSNTDHGEASADAGAGSGTGAGSMAGAPATAEDVFRQSGIHISNNANIQISGGANISVNGHSLTLGGGGSASTYRVPVPSSDAFPIMGTRKTNYEVVDLQFKDEEVIQAPADESIEWIIAYIPQSNTCVYKLKEDVVCLKRNFLSPAPPNYVGNRSSEFDFSSLLSTSNISSDLTLTHPQSGTTWRLHTAVLDTVPGLDERLGELVSYFANTTVPLASLKTFIKYLYFDSSINYTEATLVDLRAIYGGIGLPTPKSISDAKNRLGMKRKAPKWHELSDATSATAALCLDLSTDFGLITSSQGQSFCVVIDGVYAYPQWPWFRKLVDDESDTFASDRIVTLPSWCTLGMTLAIVESLQSTWTTPISPTEAAVLKSLAHQLELVEISEGTPLPVFEALIRYAP